MWITEATVPTSMPAVLEDEDGRNTVVPDGYINKWDAPMPPALVIFDIKDWDAHITDPSLSTLWKCMLEGYGYTIYDSGTATAHGTTTTLTDATKSWTPGELVNGFVKIDRAGEHYYGRITANTATTLTFEQVTWPTTLPLPPAPGVRSGDAYWIPRFESPFYAVEIPASPYIPAGYPGWQSWGWNPDRVPGEMVIPIDGPYPFWQDLQMETRLKPAAEPNPHEIWVYSDNHGIAGVTVDDIGVEGSVTITAKADHPYTPKAFKYGPVYSDDITATWGPPEPPELDANFAGVPRSGKAPLTVEFENLTQGGTHPYVKAEWDFTGDGVWDKTLTGTHAQVMADVVWTYGAPGVYTVSVRVTDSTVPEAQVSTETKLGYIVVSNDVVFDDIIDYYMDTYGTPGECDTPSLLAAADDWRDEVVPPGFDAPITTPQLLALADCWRES